MVFKKTFGVKAIPYLYRFASVPMMDSSGGPNVDSVAVKLR